jgi:hypothetical protein
MQGVFSRLKFKGRRNDGITVEQSCLPLVAAGSVLAAYAMYRCASGHPDAIVGILLLLSITFVVIPLATDWKLTIDAPHRRLHMRRRFRSTVVDLSASPIVELNLLESSTDRGLWFIQIILSDGRKWVLPEAFTTHYQPIAANIRLCCPNVTERKANL